MGSEAELLERCRRGQADAWDELSSICIMRPRGVSSFNWALDFTREDAEEICQEVFSSPSFANIDSFHGDSQFQTYQGLSHRVANKAMRDFQRNAGTPPRARQRPCALVAPGRVDPESGLTLDPPAELPSPDEIIMTTEKMALVREALDSLGEPCREIVELRYFGDLSYEELSLTLKLPTQKPSVPASANPPGSPRRTGEKSFFAGKIGCFPV